MKEVNIFIWGIKNRDKNKKQEFPKMETLVREILVAGAGLEPTTFGLWAQRATTAPPRDVVYGCKGSESGGVLQ